MALEAILERITSAGDIQAEEIQKRAKQEAQAILTEAQARAGQLYQAAYQQALEPEAGERARILNQARFDVLCQVGRARDQLVEETLEQVQVRLQDFRYCAEYPLALKRILLEILPGQNGRHSQEEMLILEADPRDQEVLEQVLREQGLQLHVDYSLKCCGGINARSPNGAIRLVNTLEARLERALPYLKPQLTLWFEQKVTGILETQPQGTRHGGL